MSMLPTLATYDAEKVAAVFERGDYGRVQKTRTGLEGRITVERLYVDRPEAGVARACLHRVPEPPAGVPVFIHPHGAPICVRVLSGDAYEMGLAWARGNQTDVPVRMVMRPAGGLWYELCDDTVQHYIWPRGVVYSISLLADLARDGYRVSEPLALERAPHDPALTALVQRLLNGAFDD